MTNGNGPSQALLASMPAEFSTAEQLHDDYVTAVRNYQSWLKGQEQKIMLWNTIRSLLLEADAGNAPMSTTDVLEALGSSRTTMKDLQWAEKSILETNVGKVRGQGQGTSLADKVLEAERLLQHYEDIELSSTAPFFYFGWQLVLRKLIVEYHAQRLRLYLYTGDLDTDAYPAMPTWRAFRSYALEAKTDDGDLRITGIFGESLQALNNHQGLMAGVASDSSFFAKLAEKDYFEQMDVIYQLTYSLSSSFIGQRIMADLAWGYYGRRRDSKPDQRFKLVDFFEKPSNPDERVVNWDARSGVDAYLGLNQQTFFAISFAVQVGPGYHRAAAMARDADDIQDAERDRIESEAATLLERFTTSPQSATSDFSLPMMGVQNQHNSSQAKSFLNLVNGSLDDKFAAVPEVFIADWAEARGIKTEFGFGPSDSVTVKNVENIPDKQLVTQFKQSVEAADSGDPDYPRWAGESSIALRRFLHLYNILGNVYGIALFFTADSRDSSTQQTLEDIKEFADFSSNMYTLTRSLKGDEIEWESIKLEGATDDSWRPTRFRHDPEQLEKRLSELDSRVKQTLIDDLDETIKHLNRLDATSHVIEYNAFDDPSTSSHWGLSDPEATAVEARIGHARNRLGYARAKANLFKTRLKNNDLAAATELIKDGKLEAIHQSSRNALEGLDQATAVLAANKGNWDVAKFQSELFSKTGMTSGLSVRGEQAYSDYRKLSPSDSPLANTSLRTKNALDEITQIKLGTDEIGELLSEGGLEKRLDSAKQINEWFSSYGSEADLQYSMRTADMLETGPDAARPAMGKFLGRVVLELVGTVADIFDLIINTMNTISSWKKGDHSAAGGFALQAAGTGMMLLAGGPVAWIGAGIFIAGIALVAFTTDSDLTLWIRHTFFGRLWFMPATLTWDEEYNRWGNFLGNVLYNADEWLEDPPDALTGEGDDDSGTASEESGDSKEFMAPKKWSQVATYTEASRDPSMKRYFAAQLAWFYKHARPFELPTAKLGTDDDGFPTLTITVEDPAESGKDSETFGFNSKVLVQPVVFTKPPAVDWVRAWRRPVMDFEVSDDMRTYQWTDMTWDEPNLKGNTEPEIQRNQGAAPVEFDLSPTGGRLQYDATIKQFGITYSGTTNPDDDAVWIDTITYEVGFRDSFKQEFKAAYNDPNREPMAPLDWLLGVPGADLERRLTLPAELSGSERANYEFGPDVLTKNLGVEVYHLPAELAKVTEEHALAKGSRMAEAMRTATLNPFAARIGATLSLPNDYPKQPREWMSYVQS